MKRTLWYAVSSNLTPTAFQAIEELKLSLCERTENGLWVVEREKALQFEIKY